MTAAGRVRIGLTRASSLRMTNQGAAYRALQIIVAVPVLLDLLLCHSRAWLPREESRSFPTSSSGIRDSSRAPDTRAGMTEKFDRADVRVTILCRTQIGKRRQAAAWMLPSPARHGGCKKDSNRRAACPLPGQGRGIWNCRGVN